MKRRGFSVWEAIVVLCLITILVILLIPVLLRHAHSVRRPSCQSNLKQVTLCVKQYIQDYGELLPLTNVNDTAISPNRPLGWADALIPYMKTQEIFRCPKQIENGKQNEEEKKPNELNYTDYWYNRRLAGVNEERINQAAVVILAGEGNDGTDATNARYSLSTLPPSWRKDKTSPAYRHGKAGANYAFVDGHVKWLKPEKVTESKPNGKNYTFAIR